ncbi:MAG: hypothetical protein ABJ370_02705 [Paracoccaceae bacterium]
MASPTKHKHPLLLLGPKVVVPRKAAHQMARLHALIAEAMTAEGIDGTTTFSASETTMLSAYICDKQDVYAHYLKNERLEPMRTEDASLRLGTQRHASAFTSRPKSDQNTPAPTADRPKAASTLDSFVFAPVEKNVAANRSMPLQPYPLQKSSVQKA